MSTKLLAGGFVMALGASLAFAHHSPALYFRDQIVSVSGVVTEWHSGRPHAYLEFAGTDESGNEKTYRIDFGGGSLMVRENEWDESTFSPGDEISVTGNPPRRGDNEILIDTLVTDFGRFTQSRPHGVRADPAGGQALGRGLPIIGIDATVTRADWSEPNVVLYVRGAADGEAERDYEVLLSDPPMLLEFAYFTADDAAPGTPVSVDGFLVEDGDRAIIVPNDLDLGDRGPIIYSRFVPGLIAVALGEEAPAGGMGRAPGGEGPAGGMGRFGGGGAQ